MSDIYFIPKTVSCPICGNKSVLIGDLIIAYTYSSIFKCYVCGNFSKIIDWINKYAAVIKDVKDET